MPLVNKRIDAGIKRGPRPQIDRRPKAALAQDRSGRMISSYPPDLRVRVVAACHEQIEQGRTPAEIASDFGVPARTVQYWLLADPQAEAARAALIASELARTLDDMRMPEDPADDTPLRLARAREEFRAWSWIAERRESRLYGPKQEVTLQVEPMGTMLQRVSQRMLSVAQPQQTVDCCAAPPVLSGPDSVEDAQVIDK